jgi:nucleoid-associated protein YgaU
VRSGDTLSGIAGKVYGDRNKWNIIYAANRDLLPRADSLRIGQVLYIPPQ